MTAAAGEATETSPLIPKPAPENELTRHSSHPIDPSGSIAPEGADPYEDEPIEDDSEVRDGGDVERQISHVSTKQYQGMPDMKKKMKYIFPAIVIGVFLSAADQTIIVTTYGIIGTDLDALNNTSWIATAYFLTVTSFQPLYGKLSDIFGRKSCLLFAYTVFGLGTLFCGLARTMNELIAARAFAGIGGGGMTTVVSILMSDIVSLRDRGAWQGYINIIYATGSGCGAPLGGVLAESVGWRWTFIAQTPLCLLAFIAVFLVLDLPPQDRSHWKQKILKIDFLGALILVAAVLGLLVGLDRGSNVGWSDKITIGALCTAPLFLVFVLVEKYVAANPFAPFRIILNRSLFACYLCNFFAFGGWLSALFFLPLYFQVVGGYTPGQAGLLLVPCIICGVSGSLFGGLYMRRTGKYYWITGTAYTTLVIGMTIALLFSGVVMNSVPLVVVGSCINGFSNGIGVTTTLIGLIANASHADQAVATACSYLFRSLGTVFGISLCATAFNQSLRVQLRDRLSSGKDAEEIAERVRQSLAYIKTLEPAVRGVVRECYGNSTQAALGVGTGIVAGATFFAWFIREKKL